MRVMPLTLDLKASRVGESTTSWGRLFHRRMVSGKKEPFSSVVRLAGTRNF